MKRNIAGCVLALALVAGAAYAGLAGLGFLWWGRGFAGALAGRHAPQRVRAASTVHIYDHVIVVERDRVVFRRSLWAVVRLSAIVGATAAIGVVVLFAVRRRRVPRLLPLAALLLAGGATFAATRARTGEVVVPRGSAQRLEARWYEFGGGRSGTKNTTAHLRGWQIVLADGTVLVRLPWNERADAEVWRALIAEKIAARP